ncbi:hypothetical protein [Sphingomonas panni]|uniref:hypothetical protein n=1 Tax=Sphingomonas panni TaxID=237612 RepID=UPI001F5B6194|nr:hypothetical protein [Sphingomonas panni]
MPTLDDVSDVKAASTVLERDTRIRYLLGDKGYDADRLRGLARDAGAVPAIPGRRDLKRTIHYVETAALAPPRQERLLPPQ